jgi:hypothetical protein
MNKSTYINIPFKGSYAETNILTSNIEQLKNRLRYAEMAVIYHMKESNEEQIKFFQEQVNLIKHRLKLQQ